MTPRYLSVFTVSFLSFSEYIGKTSTDKTQYNFQKNCPFYIAALHTIILVMRRRYLFTVDDVLISIIFMTSLSLYFALEYNKPLKTTPAPSNKDKAKQNSNTKFVKKNNLKIDSIIDEYLESELDEANESMHEETQQFLQSLIDDSNGNSKIQQHIEMTNKIKKVDYKKLMLKLLRELSEEESQKLLQMGGNFDLNNDDDL